VPEGLGEGAEGSWHAFSVSGIADKCRTITQFSGCVANAKSTAR